MKNKFIPFFLLFVILLIVGFKLKNDNVRINTEDAEVLSKFSGEWKVIRYAGSSVPFHEENYDKESQEKAVSEALIADYLKNQIKINKENVEYIYPPTELGYYYDLWSDVFSIYRVPSNIEMTPPFICAEIKTREMSEEVSIIIDENGRAILYVKGEFFEIR